MVLEVRPGAFAYYALRISNADIPATIAFIEEQWKEFFPEKVFEYDFLEASLDNLYQSESRLSNVIAYFAFIAIFISCFGLLGITALTTQQRVKEIGIRKVLGASIANIVQLFSLDFLKLVLIAILIASPMAWYLMSRWLDNFAYRTTLNGTVFLLAGTLALLIAFFTVSYQSIRASVANPTESLRSE